LLGLRGFWLMAHRPPSSKRARIKSENSVLYANSEKDLTPSRK